MFYLGQDSSLNIPSIFFSQLKCFFSAYQSLKYRRDFYFAGYLLSFVFFFRLIFCRRHNFLVVFACFMLLLLLVLFFNTQNINRTLLDNERATAKLLFNLMKSELEKDKLHQLKWQERVKDWKLIQKNHVVQSFRSEILQSILANV